MHFPLSPFLSVKKVVSEKKGFVFYTLDYAKQSQIHIQI